MTIQFAFHTGCVFSLRRRYYRSFAHVIALAKVHKQYMHHLLMLYHYYIHPRPIHIVPQFPHESNYYLVQYGLSLLLNRYFRPHLCCQRTLYFDIECNLIGIRMYIHTYIHTYIHISAIQKMDEFYLYTHMQLPPSSIYHCACIYIYSFITLSMFTY